MFNKKKPKTLGMEPKPKTLAEINQDYANEAALLGHKMMLVSNTQDQLDEHIAQTEKIMGGAQEEIRGHVKKMSDLRKMANALPQEPHAAPAPAEAQAVSS